MTQISINNHQRINWKLEDRNGKVALEATDSAGTLDGFNIIVKAPGRYEGETWLSLEEAKSLRQWLNKALDNG
jgi:hypothetical protein